MNKKNIFIISFVFLILISLFINLLIMQKYKPIIEPQSKIDLKNGTYIIENTSIKLVNGYNELGFEPNSASKTITKYFGNEVMGDFNNDGIKDGAFILTQESGGTGTFFYVTALISNGDKFIGTNSILIGDRIAPQTTEFKNGMIVVNYADRKPDEPFSTKPSVGVSGYFKIVDNQLVEINLTMPEGEAQSIAEKSCIKGGEALGAGTYNENSNTWWYDANLNSTKAGCNPACVVSADTKKAEINWRCTGAISPSPLPNQRINCSPESRKADFCTTDINPVCAKINIQCIKAPCNPINQTFNNSCEACKNPLVESYEKDECSNITEKSSTLKGKVSISPTCPVEKIPPDPSCAPKPYLTTIQIFLIASPLNTPFATVRTDINGNYLIMLPPGKYGLDASDGKQLPRCETQTVTLTLSNTTITNFSCDSGIR